MAKAQRGNDIFPIRLSEELAKNVKQYAEKHNKSVSEVIRQALRLYLAKEDIKERTEKRI